MGTEHVLVVRLVVFVPLVAGVHAVEVPRLAWAVLVLPVVRRRARDALFDVEKLFLLVQLALRFGAVQRLGEVRVARGLLLLFFGHGFDRLGDEPRAGDRAALLHL